jgi:hypothetical protein
MKQMKQKYETNFGVSLRTNITKAVFQWPLAIGFKYMSATGLIYVF